MPDTYREAERYIRMHTHIYTNIYLASTAVIEGQTCMLSIWRLDKERYLACSSSESRCGSHMCDDI